MNLEAVAEAPAGFGNQAQHLHRITYQNVAKALAEAEHLGHRIPEVLKELLQLLTEMSMTPETTALLPNYPNPFNPETWIPYQLAKPTEVTITIYAINGQVVRQLALGHQAMGLYQTRSRAAYWDGRKQVRRTCGKWTLFLYAHNGEFHRNSEDVNTQVERYIEKTKTNLYLMKTRDKQSKIWCRLFSDDPHSVLPPKLRLWD